jgi:fibronectin-binding autotransporter adhesin
MGRKGRSRHASASAKIAAAAALAVSAVARADQLSFTNSNGDFVWPESGNWIDNTLLSNHALPVAGDIAVFTDNGAGTVYLDSAQSIGTLEFTNQSNSYTFAGSTNTNTMATLTLSTINFTNSAAGNVIGPTVAIQQAGSSQLQILGNQNSLDIQGPITAPQGLDITQTDGEVILENASNTAGASSIYGGGLTATSPAAIAGISSLQFEYGATRVPILTLMASNAQTASGLPSLTVDNNAMMYFNLVSSSDAEPLGTPNLTASTITFKSLTLQSNAMMTIATPYTSDVAGVTTLNIMKKGTLDVAAANFFDPPTNFDIGSITDESTKSTLTFDGGGITSIASNSTRNGPTTISGGLVALSTYQGLGTGTITIGAGTTNSFGGLDPGGALELSTAAGAGFPTLVNVAAYAALGGNLANAIYSGAGENVSLATNSILFPNSGSALPGQVGGQAVYWLGITSDSASYSVGNGGTDIYKGAALGTFTTDAAIPVGGFIGTISDPFSQDLLVHASGFTAIGQPDSVSNGLPSAIGVGPTFNSVDGVGDITYDGTGTEMAFFAPIAGTATTINLSNSATGIADSYFALDSSGDVAAGQIYNLTSGTTVEMYQSDAVHGTLNVDAGALLLESANGGQTQGTYHIASGGKLQVTEQYSAPTAGATYEWDAGSIVNFAVADVDTASASSSTSSWFSPNSDVLVDYASTVINSLSGVSLELGAGHRITTDRGGMLFDGAIGADPGAASNANFIFSAAQNSILDTNDSVTLGPTQTLQIGDTNTWGVNNMTQNGTVVLGGNMSVQNVNVVAGTLTIQTSFPTTSVITNNAAITVQGNFVSTVGTIVGTGSIDVLGIGQLVANNITQPSLNSDGYTEIINAASFGNVTGGGTLQVDSGATLTAGNFNMATGELADNGTVSISGKGTVGYIDGTGTLTLQSGSRLSIAQGYDTINILSGLTLNGSGSTLGTLDIEDNALVITYTGASPQNQIRNWIIDGYDGGYWDGPGITSSVAQYDASNPGSSPYQGNAAIGYADNNDIGNTDYPLPTAY